jgi:hypothetical protein
MSEKKKYEEKSNLEIEDFENEYDEPVDLIVPAQITQAGSNLFTKIGNTSYNTLGLTPVSSTFRILPGELEDIITAEMIRYLEDENYHGTGRNNKYDFHTEIIAVYGDNGNYVRALFWIPASSEHIENKEAKNASPYLASRRIIQLSDRFRKVIQRFGERDRNNSKGNLNPGKMIKYSDEGRHCGVYIDVLRILEAIFDTSGYAFKEAVGTPNAVRTVVIPKIQSNREPKDKSRPPLDYIEVTKGIIKRGGKPTLKRSGNFSL